MRTFYTLLLTLISQLALAQNDFITRWNLATAGSGDTQLTFEVETSGTVSYTWQEVSPGTASGGGTFTGSTATITGLPTGSVIDLKINPTDFHGFFINNGTDKGRLVDVRQWGTASWTSMAQAFYGCSNLQISATDYPDLSGVASMAAMFRSCSVLNGPANIGEWNTENVTDMNAIFRSATAFNQSVGTWKTGEVTDMGSMFFLAQVFNQPIGSWNTAKVTNMERMFSDAGAFDQPIGTWDVGEVTNMSYMFYYASAFNQPIGNWDVGNVSNMSYMLLLATSFNQSLGAWTLNAGVSLTDMLSGSGQDCDYYSATLIGWSTNPSTPSGRSLGAGDRSYGTSAVTARSNLVTTKGWTITGDAASGSDCSGALNFITRWNLATPGSGATQLIFAVGTTGTVSYTWQEVSPGTASGSGTFTGSIATISGLPEGSVIDLKIHPTNFNGFVIYGRSDRNRLVDVRQWGTASWTSMAGAFYGCSNLQISAIDYPDLSRVTSMNWMFGSCTALNGPANIGNWNTANVTEMGYLFENARAFNQDISNWNTGKVTKMDFMFSGARLFNQQIGIWNTAKVTTMASMFNDAYAFDQPIDSQGNGIWSTANVTNMSSMFATAISFNQTIGNWDTGKVTDMSSMFYTTNAFDQPIGSWDTRNVTNMSAMFHDAGSFDQPIGDWKTGNVTDMSSMFKRADAFNQPIDDWDTGNVTNMSAMFYNNDAFNQPIGSWDTGSVTDMSAMFSYNDIFDQTIGEWDTGNVTDMSAMFANNDIFDQPIGDWYTGNVTDMNSMFAYNATFNQPIGDWDTGKVTDMRTMFYSNGVFNQPIGNWNLAKVSNMSNMFSSATSFNQSIGTWTLRAGVNIQNMLNQTGMDCYHYSETLIGWSNNPSTPSGCVLGAQGRAYGTNAVAARTNLTGTKGWTILNDAASAAECSSPLPVTLISFSGKKTAENQNTLKWITADEKDFDRFDIQRSFDARRFETIGRVLGQGDWGETNKGEPVNGQTVNGGMPGAGALSIYTFTDLTPGASNYYRLKIVDRDGSFEYSRIISIENSAEQAVVGSFYPNPSNGKVFVDVYAVESGSWTLTVTDEGGKILGTQVHDLQKGMNKIGLNRLSQGMNLVRFEHGKFSEVRKLVRE